MRKLLFTVLLFVLIGILSGCASASETNSQKPLRVVTTTSQIGDSVQQIGGENVEVTSLMGPGVDPHTYQATQNDIQTLQNADVVFYNGLHLEGKMSEIFEQISATKPVLALGEAIPEEKLLKDPKNPDVVDPHIWFDINLWKESLDKAADELIKQLPEEENEILKNKESYFTELDILLKESNDQMESIKEQQRVLVTAHDAFGYFGRLFDTEVIGLQGLSTEDELGIRDIQDTIDLLVERQIPSVFIESSISDRSIQAVIQGAAESGQKVQLGGELYSDAMGKEGTAEGTYIGMYKHNVKTIVQALNKEAE